MLLPHPAVVRALSDLYLQIQRTTLHRTWRGVPSPKVLEIFRFLSFFLYMYVQNKHNFRLKDNFCTLRSPALGVLCDGKEKDKTYGRKNRFSVLKMMLLFWLTSL